MKEDRRDDRRQQIEAAAYELLAERGFAGTSMLEIAKRARASNETLYRWYGDKVGLFAAMVERNAAAGVQQLAAPLAREQSLEQRLQAFGCALLMGILSDRAVILNRVAATDPTGELGATLARHGRETVVPMLEDLFEREGFGAGFENPADAADTFIALLLGDLQAQRFLGRMAAPGPGFCQVRATRAAQRFARLAR